MISMVRTCIRCGGEITACNGFTLTRDWLALEGTTGRLPREQCGKCVLRPDAEKFLNMLYPKVDDVVTSSESTQV